MKKSYIVIVIIIMCAICVGCGKEEAPASASTTISTVAGPTEPTNTPTTTPESNIVNVAKDSHHELVVKCDLPQNAREYLEKVEETQILPFLNGFNIESVLVDTTGATSYGYTEYQLEYRCRRGNVLLVFRFRTLEIEYDVSKVSDTLAIDQITLSVNGDVVREDLGARGLSEYTK